MKTFDANLLAENLNIAIVVSRFNDFITEKLLQGARQQLLKLGAREKDIEVAWVPGAVEIPLVAQKMAACEHIDAVICLGAVIKGATDHYDYVNSMVASGIARASLDSGKPVIFGVITVESIEQAIERAGTKAGNKGAESASAAVEMVNLLKQLES